MAAMWRRVVSVSGVPTEVLGMQASAGADPALAQVLFIPGRALAACWRPQSGARGDRLAVRMQATRAALGSTWLRWLRCTSCCMQRAYPWISWPSAMRAMTGTQRCWLRPRGMR